MDQLTLIPRVESGSIIPQRSRDGYISATALCQSVNKRYSDYRSLKSTSEFIAELIAQTGLLENQLIHIISGGNPSLQGTWVHPYLAMNLAQWLSPKFAVKVAQWVTEWQQGISKAVLPAHIERYMLNRGKIPYTHFSMLNEITLNLIAPLEQGGYTLPENMVPDISEGKIFCKWLREHRGVEPSEFPTYPHAYPDGRVVPAKLYPIELYEDFKRHFNEIWLPLHAPRYFAAKDQQALSYVKTLLLSN
ncbi:KilA-N domain-containing protein [Janthinobacterium lividum]|uniref:KilA-N domain-containing protein n=1 Tax=Janthinobacterium lividum TaxID=29581 RepID=UPI000892D2C1|nr:KilA-N domain-containing protein [Janthinobacterium lividum]MCC7713406.1 KilA-N domain-containing protein [Janthinobacterium lividum]OEZ55102.1 KilA-N domain protein [Janthinobacterium lividum]WQE26471.1 KilA-N domain-containing protein [Janthinobacterium lividum]STQ97360.1 KilA-N domain [Janthinobacterium lividum]